MTIIRLLVGAVVLALGRQLYWIFVGAAGFVAGITLATRFLGESSDVLIILLGLGAGLLGALLAVFLQHVAVSLAGLFIGGFAINTLFETFSISFGSLDWLFIIGGAILGAVMVLAVFDWALIGLSSLAGAVLIIQAVSQAVDLQPLPRGVIFFGLLLFGIALQAARMGRKESE
jgi:hypothetical protein